VCFGFSKRSKKTNIYGTLNTHSIVKKEVLIMKNKITFCILLSMLVGLSGACSNPGESVKSSTVSTNKGEQSTVAADQSESTGNNEYSNQEIQASTKAENKSETNKNQNPIIDESTEENNTTSKTAHDQLNTVSEAGNGEKIDDVFKNGSPFLDDERTIAMKEIAEDIMLQLPEAYDNIHVDSVSWVSYDGEFAMTLIQDYRK
jgi:hypothetical protein